jgi:V/A-type H+-transporting ATPase subunit C
MAGPLSTYGFISAKLKAQISKIIPQERIDELVRARSLPEAVEMLKNTDFAPLAKAYTETGDLRMGETILHSREIELYTEIRKYVDDPVLSFITALSVRYEIDNLKHAVRLWFDRTVRGRDIAGKTGFLYHGRIVHDMDIDAIVGAADFDTLADSLAGTPYAAILRENGGRVSAQQTLFPVEIALDQYFFRNLLAALSLLGRRDREIAKRMIGVEIDMQNISWIIRFKNFYNLPVDEAMAFLIPYGYSTDRKAISAVYASGNVSDILSELLKRRYGRFQALLGKGIESQSRLTLMERILQQITMAEVGRLLAGYPFTIGVILAYFILKRNEIQTIMNILNAKYYNLPEERIRSAL